MKKQEQKYEQFLFNPCAVPDSVDIKSNIELVMKEKFLERAHKQFNESPSPPENEQDEYIAETINVEGVPRTIYLNSKMSQRQLGKIRDQIRVNQFSHKDFNAFFGSKLGKFYYKGVWNSRSQSHLDPQSHSANDVYASSSPLKRKGNIPLLDENKHTMLDVMIPFHTKSHHFDPFQSYVRKHSTNTNKETKSIAFQHAQKDRTLSLEQDRLPELQSKTPDPKNNDRI